MKNVNRRSFLAGGLLLSVISFFRGQPALAQKMREKKGSAPAAAGGGGDQLIDPKDPVAQSLKYSADKSKVAKDLQKSANDKGTPFAEQKCANCSFYTVANEKDFAGKKGAPCTVMANKNVLAEAWCMSWNKRA